MGDDNYAYFSGNMKSQEIRRILKGANMKKVSLQSARRLLLVGPMAVLLLFIVVPTRSQRSFETLQSISGVTQ
jgi:aspartate carbamoyltransferase catalytic subunit